MGLSSFRIINMDKIFLIKNTASVTKKSNEMQQWKSFSKFMWPSDDLKIFASLQWYHMSSMVSQITSNLTVCSTASSVKQQWNIKDSLTYYWHFVRGIHQSLVDSPHKGPVIRKALSSSMSWHHHHGMIVDQLILEILAMIHRPGNRNGSSRGSGNQIVCREDSIRLQPKHPAYYSTPSTHPIMGGMALHTGAMLDISLIPLHACGHPA